MHALRDAVRAAGSALAKSWRPHLLKREYYPSAANLAAYIGLRRHDLRAIQRDLTTLGLSSLGRCEGHVMASLDSVIHALKQMTGKRILRRRIAGVASAMTRDEVLLRHHTNRLFGPPPANRRTRFMVTLPTEAATDYGFVREAVKGGMDCARINCAHDDAAAWRAMVRNVRRAAREAGRPCRILMDLGGPKLRTGAIETGPPLLRIRIKRDLRGRPLRPARVILDASERPGPPAPVGRSGDAPARLTVARAWLDQLRRGDTLHFVDVRGRERRLLAERRLSGATFLTSTTRGAWLGADTVFKRVPLRGARAAAATTAIGEIAAAPLEIRLGENDVLLLTRAQTPGEPKRVNRRGQTVAPAHISCSEPRVFSALKVGHHVWIDDGKIGTVVEVLDEHGAWLRVTHARPGGERVAPGKGLNFPDCELPLPALGEADLADLDVAARRADIIGFSFVRSAADMDALVQALAQRGRSDLGIIAKIETRTAVGNLPDIIVHGAGSHAFGVMIARGDLAVEIGYERMAEIQEEILWLCEAAHVPVIWATQVLEGLVKRGRPSRAEISDAAMSERAECVMLNKGPYLIQALAVLDNVIARMQHHQRKKTAQFRALHW
ncbi:MAG: pyruvate kinase [Betaproteobacteria bacterium]|nr:pyruvate kinase [Betaproteobacteria bacterium]